MSEDREHTMVQLVEKYSRLMYKIACKYLDDRELVAETLQEVLLAIYKSGDKIFVMPVEQQKKYICAICRNISIKTLMAEVRQRGISLDDDNYTEFADDFIIEEKISDIKIGCNVDYYIRQLTEVEQEILVRFYELEESHDEIAEALGISSVLSRKKLSRIKRKLAKLMSDEEVTQGLMGGR